MIVPITERETFLRVSGAQSGITVPIVLPTGEVVTDDQLSFTDEELFIAQELWSLVEQARQRGTWIFDKEKS
jgi:hypothetical protein